VIRECQTTDFNRIYLIVNEAAKAYDGAIPPDCYHQPYMPVSELQREMRRMTFFGWEEAQILIGVMALEPVKDVTLIRHAYVLPDWQSRGIGSKLLGHILRNSVTSRILVGTWANATWAVGFYKKHGFSMLPDKDKLLKKYWDIPQRQIETSVVLGIEKLG
jgi:N-acetylglutamate synthase-like GNAT family acetyltransferase